MSNLNSQKFLNTISLVKISEHEIRPMLITIHNKKLVAFKIIHYRRSIKDLIYIGRNCGLRFEGAVLTLKLYKLDTDKIIKILSVNKGYMYKKELTDIITKSLNKYKKLCGNIPPSELVSIKDLHRELKLLKKKIELCKFNNEDYSQLQARRDYIFNELGYYERINKNNNNKFNGYRVAPSKGHIKIYGLN